MKSLLCLAVGCVAMAGLLCAQQPAARAAETPAAVPSPPPGQGLPPPPPGGGAGMPPPGPAMQPGVPGIEQPGGPDLPVPGGFPGVPGGGMEQPRAPGMERGWRREGGQQGIPGAFMERLRQERPELHERLSKLYREDRQKFFQEVRNLMRERGLQVPDGEGVPGRARRESPEEQKCIELSRLYQEAKDDAEKERLRGELAEAIQSAFEARLQASKERIANLEEQLQDFRQHLDRLEANRERICDERFQELTKPAELRWDGNW